MLPVAFLASVANAVNPDWLNRWWGSCSYHAETYIDPEPGHEAEASTIEMSPDDCEVQTSMYYWDGSTYVHHVTTPWDDSGFTIVLTSQSTTQAYGYHQMRDLPDYDLTRETFASCAGC